MKSFYLGRVPLNHFLSPVADLLVIGSKNLLVSPVSIPIGKIFYPLATFRLKIRLSPNYYGFRIHCNRCGVTLNLFQGLIHLFSLFDEMQKHALPSGM